MDYKKLIRERDACAIIAFVDKKGHSSHANITRTIDALRMMGHRSGDIDGEGDGAGIIIDIPREVWALRFERYGINRHLTESSSFFLGHFLLPARLKGQEKGILERIREVMHGKGLDILMELKGNTRDEELGPRARADAPLFWQVAGLMDSRDRKASMKKLFCIQIEMEKEYPELHVASLSLESASYKLRGMPELLQRVYPDLSDENARSVITLGHTRYSTNTLPTVERAQPFSILAHNGEINTIERLISTGETLGIRPVPDGSDSQSLNRIIEGLIHLYDLDPMEAFSMVFPPVRSEVDFYPQELRDLFHFYRWFFPCSAQGPAGVIARYGNTFMASVDALGLRPLWFGESDYEYFISSEKGVIDLDSTMDDPRPLAPGEKLAIIAERGIRAQVFDWWAFQKRLARLMSGRKKTLLAIKGLYKSIPEGLVKGREKVAQSFLDYSALLEKNQVKASIRDLTLPRYLSAFGWNDYDLATILGTARKGTDIVGSMGYQGPLPALAPDALPNISEYLKENVAVVTNPAIDREREAEHFSTHVILGDKPDILGEKYPSPMGLEIRNPLLVDAGILSDQMDISSIRDIAMESDAQVFEDVLSFFTSDLRDKARLRFLDATFSMNQGLETRLDELCSEAKEAVENGATLLILDDRLSFSERRVFIDPGLLTARLSNFLSDKGLRRNCSLIVRSGAVRNLHDIMFLLGLGADAICPYLLLRVAMNDAEGKVDKDKALFQVLDVFKKGMEKVMSTMGIHEICGYGRIFASIGLARDVECIFKIKNFCPSEKNGLSFPRLEEMAKFRYERANSREEVSIYKLPKRNPKVGRVIRDVAVGKKGYLELSKELEKIDRENPIAIRHLIEIKKVEEGRRLGLDQVDISVGRHSMPLVIAAMSFGSQGENSFRSYAEAAKKINIVCLNGEGGEIPDMLGRYKENRGQQIASGRFGVFMGLLNSADFLEIKIGQGAKPGEGGHLPGVKVSEMVSRARHCKPGITLISPSNQHDIYSIEDLAQIITELKLANPIARVSVKIPVTSGVGTIAVGIAKAGADIINISGFEGGTGAAREHAKKYVGLPVEIGVREAHSALLASGLRDRVEIWCDGGLRSGADCVKLILLGANRVGMGTVALMGIGCISCERCHLDRCPRGISTQLRSKEEAETRGVKGFVPRVVEVEAENLARVFSAIGDEIRGILADMGEKKLQDLVGRVDLLSQARFQEAIDLSDMLSPVPFSPVDLSKPKEITSDILIRRPLSYLTRLISDISMDQFRQGKTLVHFTDHKVRSTDRGIGTYLSGAMVREFGINSSHKAFLRLESSVPGNGMCAFNIPDVDTIVDGGSQDGAAKGAIGGLVAVLKGVNCLGRRIDGSVGKSFAYGAIKGTLIVQNLSDSRACIRMSGADAVFGARITKKVRDDEGNIAGRAHLKGFAFEYMTGGRVVVLGDPGPWICAGMTGGVIYQCLYPEFFFTKDSLRRRFSQGALVHIKNIDEDGLSDVRELLGKYIKILKESSQDEEAGEVERILASAHGRFVMIVPKAFRPPSAA